MTFNLKTGLKLLGGLLLILLILGFLVPVLFKKEISSKIKTAINQNLNGSFDFEDASLSIFTHFPRLTLSLKKPSVVSYATGDTLNVFKASELSLSFDFWDIISKSESLVVKSFYLYDADIQGYIDANGVANYDILKNKQPASNNSDTKAVNFKLDRYEVKNSRIIYIDKQTDMSLKIVGLNNEGKCSILNDIFDIKAKTTIDSLDFVSTGISFLNHVNLNSNLNLIYDASKNRIDLKENELALNALKLSLLGYIQVKEEQSIEMDLKLNSPGTQFKDLFSLIPKAFIKNYQDVKSEGSFLINANINGILNQNSNIYPSWDFVCSVTNGGIQYPGMPVRLSAFNLNMSSKNIGPDLSKITVDLNPFSLLLNDKPVNGTLHFEDIVDNAHVIGNIKANLDLNDYKQFMPLDKGVDLSGLIHTDLSFDFRKKQVELGDFENIALKGDFVISNLIYKDLTMPRVAIPKMNLEFNPKLCNISNAQIELGRSDINLKGYIENPLTLLMDEGEIKSNVQLKGNVFDANEWLEPEASSASNTEPIDSSFFVLNLCKRLNVSALGSYQKIIYDTYLMDNSTVQLDYIKDKLNLKQLNMTINQNVIQGNGIIDGPMAWVYQNKTLKGDIRITGEQFNLTKFMESGSTIVDSKNQTAVVDTAPFKVPDAMDFGINFSFRTLSYDKLVLNNFKGNLQIVQDEIQFRDLTSSALGGQMNLAGIFNTEDSNKPKFDLKYDLKKIQFGKAFESIVSVQKLAPIIKFIEGFFNSSFVCSGSLNKDLSPNLDQLNLSGIIETLEGAIKNYKPIELIAQKLKLDDLKSLNLKNTKNWFSIENGVVSLKEMSKTWNDIDMKVLGTSKLSGPMDFDFKFRIPRNKINNNAIGASAETGLSYLKSLANKAGVNIETGSHINVLVNLSGLYTDPKFSFKLLNADGQSIENSGSELVNQAVDKAKDSIIKRADQELDKAKQKAMEEAKKLEDSLRNMAIRKADEEKQKALDKLGTEAAKHIDSNLVNKGKEVLNDKLGKNADKILKDGGKKEADQIKEKVKDWNPFKKK